MFTDIVGYSAMMAADEEAAMNCLAKQRAIFESLIASHHGCLHKEMGDGTLSSFSSAKDALACAAAIQSALVDRKDFSVRIGLHIGEAVFSNDDIYGDGVNIAARLEPLAKPGGIVVSGAFYDAVRSQLDFSFQCLGDKSLKNIGRSVTVYQVHDGKPMIVRALRIPGWKTWIAGASAAVLLVFGLKLAHVLPTMAGDSTVTSVQSLDSIAVLPFVNMSSDKEQEYFSDGLSEELLKLLAPIPQLRVIARTSSFSFKGKGLDVATIAKTLNVGAVLAGSVRKSGTTVRITAQLIRASDSAHLWSETYDRQVRDVFQVQDEIAHAVVSALRVRLLPTQKLANQNMTSNPDAYTQFLMASQLIGRQNSEGYHLAARAYEKAVALAPDYAAAYAGLANAHAYNAVFAETREVSEAERRVALEAANKAIALAPDLANAYVVRSWVRFAFEWDWRGAQADMARALALDPGDSMVQRRNGMLLAVLGRYREALEATKKATELDPMSAPAWSNLGDLYNSEKQYGLARLAMNRALAINSDFSFALGNLGMTELLDGNAPAALALFKREGGSIGRAGIAMAEHTLGHPKESQQALEGLIKTFSSNSAFQLAWVYAWPGEQVEALKWLDRAFEQRGNDFATIRRDPIFAAMREQPGFTSLVKRIKFPD